LHLQDLVVFFFLYDLGPFLDNFDVFFFFFGDLVEFTISSINLFNDLDTGFDLLSILSYIRN